MTGDTSLSSVGASQYISGRPVIPGSRCEVGCRMARLAGGCKTGQGVVGIGAVVIVVLVAGIAIRRGRHITAGVTGNAGLRRVSAGQRKGSRCVIKYRGRPGNGVVAGGAILAKAVGDMVGAFCALEIHLVAAVAGCRGSRISSRVARCARLGDMGAG